MKILSFPGYLSGDGESFCWDVEPEIFRDCKEREPDNFDGSMFDDGLVRLYPDDVLRSLDRNKQYMFTVFAEEIPED